MRCCRHMRSASSEGARCRCAWAHYLIICSLVRLCVWDKPTWKNMPNETLALQRASPVALKMLFVSQVFCAVVRPLLWQPGLVNKRPAREKIMGNCVGPSADVKMNLAACQQLFLLKCPWRICPQTFWAPSAEYFDTLSRPLKYNHVYMSLMSHSLSLYIWV